MGPRDLTCSTRYLNKESLTGQGAGWVPNTEEERDKFKTSEGSRTWVGEKGWWRSGAFAETAGKIKNLGGAYYDGSAKQVQMQRSQTTSGNVGGSGIVQTPGVEEGSQEEGAEGGCREAWSPLHEKMVSRPTKINDSGSTGKVTEDMEEWMEEVRAHGERRYEDK